MNATNALVKKFSFVFTVYLLMHSNLLNVQVPRLEKFCFCMDVPTGVRNFSIGLIILWAIYFLGAFLGTKEGESSGSKTPF